MCLITAKSVLIITLLVHSVLGIPFKFPDQQSQPEHNRYEQQRLGQSEGRFLNIKGVPSGLFNRLTSTNNLQDDIEDYDDNVGSQQSAITSPTPSLQDVEDRRRHRNRKRPCMPYSLFRNNPNGRQTDQGRTFFSLYLNDYNYYGGQNQAQHDPVGGYPCNPLGGHQRPQRPHRPHRPLYPGSNPLGDGVSNDTPGTGNQPGGLGFFGPGGLFDVNMILSNWLRPQSGASSSPGVLSEPTAGSDSGTNGVKPILEFNVQDTVQDVVTTVGGFFGAAQGLLSQRPPLQSPLFEALTTPPATTQNDQPQMDTLIQPRPSKRPHKHHHRPFSRPHPHHHYSVHEVTQIANEATQIADQALDAVAEADDLITATGPQTFGTSSRNSNGNRNTQHYPWWSFFGLFDNSSSVK